MKPIFLFHAPQRRDRIVSRQSPRNPLPEGHKEGRYRVKNTTDARSKEILARSSLLIPDPPTTAVLSPIVPLTDIREAATLTSFVIIEVVGGLVLCIPMAVRAECTASSAPNRVLLR